MFDPRDLATDPRTRPEVRPRRDHARESGRSGSATATGANTIPAGQSGRPFQDRTDRAVADVGMYRNVAYRDVWLTLTLRDTLTRRGGPWIR